MCDQDIIWKKKKRNIVERENTETNEENGEKNLSI